MEIKWKAANSYTPLDYSSDYLATAFDDVQGELKVCKEQFCSAFPNPLKFKGTTFKILVVYGKKTTVTVDAKAVKNFLNQVEKKMGFRLSKVTDVTKDSPTGGALLVESSNSWAKTGPLLHLYCLFVRNGSRHSLRCKWQTTVEKWIQGEGLCRLGDNAQFKTVGLDLMEAIVKGKGVVEEPPLQKIQSYDNQGNLFITENQIHKSPMRGLGICQYAALVNKKKVGAVAA
jgi:hypothetical protein